MALKHYRVTAFFPDAPSPYAHLRLLVSASDFGPAIGEALRTFRRNEHLKGKHLRSVQVTATVDHNERKVADAG